MRFETSHTTPSYLNRRLQWRMLSCVGVISLVMITLSLSKGRSPSPSTAASRSALAAANLAMDAAPLEHRVLKPGEVIILPSQAQQAENGHQGPRGQWADDSPEDNVSPDYSIAKGRLRADPANGDLFQPRSQEQLKTSPLFERRHGTPVQRDTVLKRETQQRDIQQRDTRRPVTDFDWDEVAGSAPKRTPERQPVPERVAPKDRKPTQWQERTESPTSPPSSDPLADFVVREDLERDSFLPKPGANKPLPKSPSLDRRDTNLRDEKLIVPPRSKPLLVDDAPPRRGQPDNDRLLADDRQPIGDDDLFDLTSPPVSARPTRKNEPPTSSFSDAVERGGTPAIPIDLRRRDDRWAPSNSLESDRDAGRDELTAVEIDKQFLDVVQDNTMGIRRDEAKPYYWLLDRARRIAASRFEKAGRRDVQYINLMTEPDRFRGDPITIEGDLWRLYEYETSRNDYGVERVYEGWVFTGDSANHPFRVVFTSLPKGIEPGENLRKPVRLTGYFFKREGYQSNGGVHFAPTLLARRIGINPMPNGIPLTSGIVPYMIVVIMAVGLGLLVTTVGFAISDERSTRSGRQRRGVQPQFSFAGLTVPSPISVEESLRDFAERERQTAISGAYGPLLSRQAAREHAVHSYSTSKQFAIDDQRRQHERQNGILQDWSARQKSTQLEHEQQRQGTRSRSAPAMGPGGDDLDSDKLAQVRHLVPKGNPPTRTVLEDAPIMISPHAQFPSQSAAPVMPVDPLSSVYSAPRPHDPPPSYGAVSQGALTQSPVAPPTIPSNISYGASKLSEWEEEAAKMANRSAARGAINPLGTITVSESSSAELIEQDRVVRERAIRERIQQQQDETEQRRREQLERERLQRDRIEHEHQVRDQQLRDQQERERQERLRAERDRMDRERLEFERLDRERLDREQLERERAQQRREYDRSTSSVDEAFDSSEIADATESSAASGNQDQPRKRRGGGWGWPARRKNANESIEPSSEEFDESFESTESAADGETSGEPRKRRGGWGWPRRRKETEQTAASDETTPDGSTPDDSTSAGDESSQSSSGWGRRRKHRRNWRNDDTSSS